MIATTSQTPVKKYMPVYILFQVIFESVSLFCKESSQPDLLVLHQILCQKISFLQRFRTSFNII